MQDVVHPDDARFGYQDLGGDGLVRWARAFVLDFVGVQERHGLVVEANL